MAATTTYTSKPLVKGYLPRSYSATDLPDSSDATFESIDTKILNVSRTIDSILGSVFCVFNSTTDSPPTPYPIREVATLWTAGLCLRQLGPGDRNSALAERGDRYCEESERRCNDILGRSMPGGDSRVIPLETATQTLTFGAGGGYDLNIDEAFITVHSLLTSGEMPTLVVDSVRPTLAGYTTYHIGRDFEVYFHDGHQKWVFRDVAGAFRVDAGTKSISYRWDWRRHGWAPAQVGATATSLIGGF